MTDRRSLPVSADFVQLTDAVEGDGSVVTAQTLSVEPSDDPGNTAPTIGNLHLDVVEAAPNETVFLDLNLDSTVTDQDLAYLGIQTWDQNGNVLGFHTQGNGIEITDREIRIGGIHIGTIQEGSDETSINIEFTEAALPGLVQRLIRALTFTTADTNSAARIPVVLFLADQSGNHTFTEVDIVLAPPGVHALTLGTDILNGSDDDDIFVTRWEDLAAGDQISGGGGNDTLRLDRRTEPGKFDLTQITISGIEKIQGSRHIDQIVISDQQLAGVTHIDGGNNDSDYDSLYLSGTNLDLRGKTITNFRDIRPETDDAVVRTDSKNLAMKVMGHISQNDKLILTSGELTEQERAILHRQGFDTITAVTGGVQTTTTRSAPQIAHLDGDSVISSGNDPVLLDAGMNASVTDDDGQFGSLKAYVTTRTNGSDVLGIANLNGVTVDSFGSIRVGGSSIGWIANSSEGPSELWISFYTAATAEQVQKLIQVLTYRHEAGALAEDLEIKIELTDIGGRRTSQTVTVEASDRTENNPPEIGNLGGDVVVSTGRTPVFLDVDSNATVSDDDEFFLPSWSMSIVGRAKMTSLASRRSTASR